VKKRERVARLAAALALGGRATAERLAEILGTPETTVYSDIRTLRRSGVPIQGEPGPGGGFRLTPKHTEASIDLTPRDSILLLLAAGALLSRPPAPAGAAAMRTALQNLLSALPRSLSDLTAAIAAIRFAPPDTPDVSLYSDISELVTNAILAKLPLTIGVRFGGATRTVSAVPEAIRWNADGWKLLARAPESGETLELDMGSITSVTLASEPGLEPEAKM
jgi:predicted DNA-binding transcriptional regulator YafY